MVKSNKRTSVSVKIPSGIVKSTGVLEAAGRYIDGDHVRFSAGKPEKIGGWAKLRSNVELTSAFTTTNASPTVTVSYTQHGLVVGQHFTIDSPSATVGGLAMNGDWEVASVVNANSFTFTHTSNATSSAGPSATCNITVPMSGLARAAIVWASAEGTTTTAIGTTERVYVVNSSNVIVDITPQDRRYAVTQAFSTVSGTKTITVTHQDHGLLTGNVITITQMDGPVGGLDLEGTWTITWVNNSTYTFQHGSNASTTETGVGSGSLFYKKALTSVFTTVNTSNIVTVAYTLHGMFAGQKFTIDSASGTVGGLTMDGNWEVATVVNANSFTFIHTGTASSSAGPSANCNITVDYPPGEVNASGGYGWGIGDYGEEDYGSPRSATSVYFQPHYWSLTNFGKLLMLAPLYGGLFMWDPDENPPVRPSRVVGAPAEMRGIFTTPERFLVAWGASETDESNGDDMLVRWCSQADFFDWVPGVTNTANSRKLTVGKAIMAGGVLGEGLSMIWTDTAAYTMRYTGSRYVYETRVAGTHCGCVGPQAWTEAGGRAFWFGNSQFWSYGAGVERVPNQDDILPWLLDRMKKDNLTKTVAFFNPRFNEVWFIFSCGPSGEPDTYVSYNITEGCWATGTMERTAAYIIGTGGNERPHLIGTDGYVYTHELGVDADGEPLEAYIESGTFQVEDGEALVNIMGFVPDFSDQSGDVTVTLEGRDRPRDAPDTDVLTVSETDKLVDARIRGRHMALKIYSNQLNGFFALGDPVLQIGSGGRKR